MDSWLTLAIGLILGVVIGWLLGSRRAAASPADSRLEAELREMLRQREAELGGVRRQLDETGDARAAAQALQSAAERQLAEARTERARAETDQAAAHERARVVAEQLAESRARLEAAERLLADQKALHEKANTEAKAAQDKTLADLRDTFRALSADALKQSQPEFLRLANETLAKFQEKAKGDLAERQQAIATLVRPLEEQLKTYQQRLQQSETAQAAALGEVKRSLETLSAQSQLLANETQQFRTVLKSNQARGRWGEETLRNVVEAAGMSAHCDFSEQTQAGDSKPDLIVHLPGDRLIIVDAKVPDLDFLSALDEADPQRRGESLQSHAAKLKATIKALGDRDYPRQFPQALDYVVLFLPAESLFSAALEGDRDLIIWAAQKRILLATPASLIALLRSVSISWQQHAQSENARAIAEASQELYTRVAKFTEHLERIRSGLEKATGAFNDAAASYQTRVRPAGERMIQLGGGSSTKELADVQPLDNTLRLPPAEA